MSFVLDTCALSELTRPAPDPSVATWFAAQDSEALYLSVLTVGEIIRAWDVQSGKELHPPEGLAGCVSTVAFSSDGG